MNRIAITDGEGQWFDSKKAEVFKEEKFWDGRNYISVITMSQFHHESLYLTRGGKWVLNKYSDYQSHMETYHVISEDEATVWFLTQNLDLPEPLKGKELLYEI